MLQRKKENKRLNNNNLLECSDYLLSLALFETPAEKKSDWRQTDRRCSVEGVGLRIKTKQKQLNNVRY